MKRLLALLLLLLLVSPMVGFAEQPFIFRDRYTWGMSLDEVKTLATQEGLALYYEGESQLSYENVPVAGIVAQRLIFLMLAENGLDQISYTFTKDPQEALVLYPSLLKQLTSVYGQPDDTASKEFMAQWQLSQVSIWPMPNVFIVLLAQDPDGYCTLVYLRDKSLLPSPDLALTTNGL